MMFKLVAVAACAAVLTVLAPTARADITYNLNATAALTGGSPAGTVTGFFITNDARTTVVAYNIMASAAGGFLGFDYTPSSATLTASALPSQYFRLDSLDRLNELQIFFTSGLGTDGGTLNPTNSYENERSGGNRFLSGSVTVSAAPLDMFEPTPPTEVPEPVSFALLGLGTAGILAVRRRRVA